MMHSHEKKSVLRELNLTQFQKNEKSNKQVQLMGFQSESLSSCEDTLELPITRSSAKLNKTSNCSLVSLESLQFNKKLTFKNSPSIPISSETGQFLMKLNKSNVLSELAKIKLTERYNENCITDIDILG